MILVAIGSSLGKEGLNGIPHWNSMDCILRCINLLTFNSCYWSHLTPSFAEQCGSRRIYVLPIAIWLLALLNNEVLVAFLPHHASIAGVKASSCLVVSFHVASFLQCIHRNCSTHSCFIRSESNLQTLLWGLGVADFSQWPPACNFVYLLYPKTKTCSWRAGYPTNRGRPGQ